MDKNGGCDQRCINSPGSFNCLCNVGFDLYTENGTAGFTIPSSETGFKDGDIYRVNKTCVRKSICDFKLYFIILLLLFNMLEVIVFIIL